MKKQQYQILSNRYQSLQQGQIVEGKRLPNKMLLLRNGTKIKNEDFITLKEELSSDDIRKVKALIRSQFELFFWRLYTKSTFVLK